MYLQKITHSGASDLELRDASGTLLYFNGLGILPVIKQVSMISSLEIIPSSMLTAVKLIYLRAFWRKSLMSRICFGCVKYLIFVSWTVSSKLNRLKR
jgi:hypothetical protein